MQKFLNVCVCFYMFYMSFNLLYRYDNTCSFNIMLHKFNYY